MLRVDCQRNAVGDMAAAVALRLPRDFRVCLASIALRRDGQVTDGGIGTTATESPATATTKRPMNCSFAWARKSAIAPRPRVADHWAIGRQQRPGHGAAFPVMAGSKRLAERPFGSAAGAAGGRDHV